MLNFFALSDIFIYYINYLIYTPQSVTAVFPIKYILEKCFKKHIFDKEKKFIQKNHESERNGRVHFLSLLALDECTSLLSEIFIVLRQFNNKFGFIWGIFCWFWNLEWSKIFLVQGLRDIDWLSLNKIINCFDWIKLSIAWTNQYKTSLDELGFKIICSKLGWSLIFKKDKHLKGSPNLLQMHLLIINFT